MMQGGCVILDQLRFSVFFIQLFFHIKCFTLGGWFIANILRFYLF